MTINQKKLLDLLSKALFNPENNIPNDVDWREIYQEARMQTVVSLLFSDNAIEVPDDIRDELKKKIGKALANNMRVDYEHNEIDGILSSEGIPYVILKGCASASYYNSPILRSLGDVDVLVSPDNLSKVDEILCKLGFEPDKEKHVCHVAYTRDKTCLELHFEPSGIPSGMQGVKVREYLKDTISTGVEYKTETGRIMIPDEAHHGLITLLHIIHHMTEEGIGIRHLCDWAVFVNNVDVPKILGECFRDVGIWRFAQLLTQLSVKYLGLPKQDWAMENEDESLLETIINDIFMGGNFGRKEEGRADESYLISSIGKYGVGQKTIVGQGIISINEVVNKRMPITKKYKILLPIGWSYVIGRQIFRMVIGKRRKANLYKIFKGASERKDIYKEFHLFECK